MHNRSGSAAQRADTERERSAIARARTRNEEDAARRRGCLLALA